MTWCLDKQGKGQWGTAGKTACSLGSQQPQVHLIQTINYYQLFSPNSVFRINATYQLLGHTPKKLTVYSPWVSKWLINDKVAKEHQKGIIHSWIQMPWILIQMVISGLCIMLESVFSWIHSVLGYLMLHKRAVKF